MGIRSGTIHSMQVVEKGVYAVEGLEYAVGCVGVERTAWVIYRVDGRNFVGEFYYNEDNLILNRYYHKYTLDEAVTSK